MGKVKAILLCAFLVVLTHTVWQLVGCEMAYYELQDEMTDLISMNNMRIAGTAPKSDEDLREAIIAKARSRGVELAPRQITVERSASSQSPPVYLSADYKSQIVVMPGYILTLHYQPKGGIKR